MNPCIRVTCEVIGTSAVHPRILSVFTFTRRALGRNHNVSMQLEDIAKCSCAVCVEWCLCARGCVGTCVRVVRVCVSVRANVCVRVCVWAARIECEGCA